MTTQIDAADDHPILNLDDLLIGRRPDGFCVACNFNRFVVTSGMPDIAGERLAKEREIMRAAMGDERAWIDEETFDALVHVMRCQRCGHEETVFLPPIDPPIIGERMAVMTRPFAPADQNAPADDVDDASLLFPRD